MMPPLALPNQTPHRSSRDLLPHPGTLPEMYKERARSYLRLLSRVSSSEEKVPLLALWGARLCLRADSSSPDNRVFFFFFLPNNFLKGWNLPPFFLSVNYEINTQLQFDRAVPLNLGTNYHSATPGQESQGKGQP